MLFVIIIPDTLYKYLYYDNDINIYENVIVSTKYNVRKANMLLVV